MSPRDVDRQEIQGRCSSLVGKMIALGASISELTQSLPAPTDDMANGSQAMDWPSSVRGVIESAGETIQEAEAQIRKRIAMSQVQLDQEHEHLERLCAMSGRYNALSEDSGDVPPLQWQTRYRVVLDRRPDADVPDVAFESPGQLAKFLWPILQSEPGMTMIAMAMDAQNRIIGWHRAYAGTHKRAYADPRLIVQGALLLNADGIIVAHNQPGAGSRPSPDALALASRIARAGNVLGVSLIDYLVFGDDVDDWSSLRVQKAWA